MLRVRSESNLSQTMSQYSGRKNQYGEIKKLLKLVSHLEISGRLSNLVQEMYMDAEYHERTSTHMRNAIINLENDVHRLEKAGHGRHNQAMGADEEQYIYHLQESVKRYEKLLSDKDN